MLLLIIFIILLGSEVLFEDEQSTTLNLSKNGTVTFKKIGKFVFITARATCKKEESLILSSNYALIPDWAIPTQEIMFVNSSGGKSLEGNTTSDMNGDCIGKIFISVKPDESLKRLSTVMYNKSTTQDLTLTMNLCYPVD